MFIMAQLYLQFGVTAEQVEELRVGISAWAIERQWSRQDPEQWKTSLQRQKGHFLL